MEGFKFHIFVYHIHILTFLIVSFCFSASGQSDSINFVKEQKQLTTIGDSQNNKLNGVVDTNLLTKNKAEFILDIASQIVFPIDSVQEFYKIGIYGRSREIRDLYEAVKLRSYEQLIQNKQIEVFNFKNVRRIEQVDLLYLSGESKIRIKDISKKLVDQSYIIVTENFPFGTSMLNFTVDESNELQFEIQDESLENRGAVIDLKLLEAKNRIIIEKNWGKKLKRSEQLLEVEIKRSDKQEDIIEEQIEEIIQKEERITGQQRIIIFSISFITLMLLMSLLIYRLSRQRKMALKQVYAKNKEITDSINYAKHIQSAILPALEKIKTTFVDAFIVYLPKDIISGDFYWFKILGDETMLSVADCTGHGVPGAILSIMGNDLLSYIVDSSTIGDPAKVLHIIDERIRESLNQHESNRSDGMDMSILSYNSEKQIVNYAGANRALIMIRNKELSELKPERNGLGGYNTVKKKEFKNNTINANSGDCFYMFSDGLQDQFGGLKKKKFMRRRLYKLFLDIHELPFVKQKEEIIQTYKKWKGNEEQVDDILVVGIKI